MTKRIYILFIIFMSVCNGIVAAQEVIPMKKEVDGVYTLPCTINGLNLRFILDTGASSVSISLTEATFMLKNGYLNEGDIEGTTNVQTADGKIAENYIVNLKEVKIGSIKLNNIQAVVSSGLDAPLLLGQSVLDQLGCWSIQNNNLILNDFVEDSCQFNNVNELISYCKSIYYNGNKSQALQLLKSFENGANINAQIAYIDLIRRGDTNDGYADQCIDSILNYNFSNAKEEFDALRLIARFYHIFYDDEAKSVNLYETLARNKKYDKSYRYQAYESLYITYMYSSPIKANAYALEALNQGMYELTMWYCGEYLVPNNKFEEAFKWYQKGFQAGELHSIFGLARGYVEGTWAIKDITKGLRLLSELAHNNHYSSAIHELCEYYWRKENFKMMIKYAQMFDKSNYDEGMMYEALAYYNLKDYGMAINRLEHTDPTTLRTMPKLNCYYYFLFGMIYLNGFGTAPDLAKAFDHLSILAEKDAGWGNSCLGDYYSHELQDNPDYERAYKHYKIGANNDDGYCYYRLAVFHKYGIGTYKSAEQSNKYKQEAKSRGIDVSYLEK